MRLRLGVRSETVRLGVVRLVPVGVGVVRSEMLNQQMLGVVEC